MFGGKLSLNIAFPNLTTLAIFYSLYKGKEDKRTFCCMRLEIPCTNAKSRLLYKDEGHLNLILQYEQELNWGVCFQMHADRWFGGTILATLALLTY